MQSAETVVEVLRARGRRGLPCERLYRQLFNPALFLMAWGRIYANDGAMTPGINGETADGMSLAKIGRIIDALRHERYRFEPVKRVYIPKKNGRKRPLGLPSWSDKLVGEVVRILLEAYYEPRFSGRSHGFRPGRGCHTALSEVANTWKGTTWFIEGDISDCFGSLDHEVMISVLAEHIHDNRVLRLIKGMLRAGYLEDWIWNATLSGAPQGGVVSPVLSNIYLDRLDKFAETVLIPEYTRGTRRIANPGPRPGSCVSSGAACRPGILVTPATAGSGIPGTPMTISSGSPARRPKRRKSSSVSPGSCATSSSWNCRRTRR
jgi:retron-type reverse transcriptase